MPSPGRMAATAIDVDAFASPSPSPGRTVNKAIDVDEVGAGYTPEAHRTHSVNTQASFGSSPLSQALASAAMHEDSDSDSDSESAQPPLALPPAEFNQPARRLDEALASDTEDSIMSADDTSDDETDDEAEARLRRLATYSRHALVIASPGPRASRMHARAAALRARLANSIHVAADAEQAETTAAELRAARERRNQRDRDIADIQTVLVWSAEQRAQQRPAFQWKESSAYLTDERPPDSPHDELVDPDLACTICAEVLSHPVMTSCKHVFCFVCLRGNMEISVQCPVCRTVQRVAPSPSPAFTRLHESAARLRYPGWRDNSQVRIKFKNLRSLNGESLV
ncbi:hypothetical protein C8F01DRAFT_1264420 [Mycena amicta]|nr:hypothetical protein C8F01DRAFT_1264420 [Mycena amicta]